MRGYTASPTKSPCWLLLVCLGFLLVVFYTERVRAADDFSAVEVAKYARAQYPAGMLAHQHAGMVDVYMMVDKKGRSFAPVIGQSTDPRLEEAAIEATQRYQFIPAKLNGVPVESRYSIRIIFQIKNASDSVSPKFAKNYRRFQKEAAKAQPSSETLLKYLKRMENAKFLSAYALSYISIARLQYAQMFLGALDQIYALQRLLLFDSRTNREGEILDSALRLASNRNLLGMYIDAGMYGDAEAHFAYMDDDEEGQRMFADSMQQIDDLRRSNQPFAVPMQISERGHTLFEVFKHRLRFDQVDGALEQLILRCQKHYAEFTIEPQKAIEVDTNWGRCLAQVSGDPMTKFRLIQ